MAKKSHLVNLVSCYLTLFECAKRLKMLDIVLSGCGSANGTTIYDLQTFNSATEHLELYCLVMHILVVVQMLQFLFEMRRYSMWLLVGC